MLLFHKPGISQQDGISGWHHSHPFNPFPRRDLTCLCKSRPAASKVQQPPCCSWAPRQLCQLPLGPSPYICPVLATSPLCLSPAREISHQGWDYSRDQPRFPFSPPRNTRNPKPKPFPRPVLTHLPPWHFLKGLSVPWYPRALQKLKSTNSVRPQPCEPLRRDFIFKRKNYGAAPKKKPQVLKSYD